MTAIRQRSLTSPGAARTVQTTFSTARPISPYTSRTPSAVFSTVQPFAPADETSTEFVYASARVILSRKSASRAPAAAKSNPSAATTCDTAPFDASSSVTRSDALFTSTAEATPATQTLAANTTALAFMIKSGPFSSVRRAPSPARIRASST